MISLWGVRLTVDLASSLSAVARDSAREPTSRRGTPAGGRPQHRHDERYHKMIDERLRRISRSERNNRKKNGAGQIHPSQPAHHLGGRDPADRGNDRPEDPGMPRGNAAVIQERRRGCQLHNDRAVIPCARMA